MDLKLDTATGEILLDDNGNALTVTDREAIAQDVVTALLTWKGEWFRDTLRGVDYMNIVFSDQATMREKESEIKRIMRSRPGVIDIKNFVSVTENSGIWQINCDIITLEGEIPFLFTLS